MPETNKSLRLASIFLLSFCINAEIFALELRNFRQYEAHLSTATGVPTSNYNVDLIAKQARSGLAATSDVKSYNGTLVRSASHVAAAYCDVFLSQEKQLAPAKRRAHAPVNFSLPLQQIGADTIKNVISNYALLFWDRGIKASELAKMDDIAGALRAEMPNTPAGAIKLFGTLCTLTATSLESLVSVY